MGFYTLEKEVRVSGSLIPWQSFMTSSVVCALMGLPLRGLTLLGPGVVST